MSAETPEKAHQPRKLSSEERERFLAQPHIGVLSVASDDDRPPSTLPTWHGYRPGGNIAIALRRGKRKSRLIERAGVLSFSVQQPVLPYKYVTVEGTVVKQQRPSRDELVATAVDTSRRTRSTAGPTGNQRVGIPQASSNTSRSGRTAG